MKNLVPITDISAPELHPYAHLSERQLRRLYEPGPGCFIAESPNVIIRALETGYRPLSFLADQSEISHSENDFIDAYPDIPVYTADDETLCKITGFHLVRGVLCLMQRHEQPDPFELIKDMRRVVVLEDVMNPTNVGAIFRSAAALNADAILLTEACSDPLYRRSTRVSMGTVFQIPWAWLPEDKITADTDADLKHPTQQPPIYENENWQTKLHHLGFQTVAMALKEDSYSLDDPIFASIPKLAIVLGTEGDGLKTTTLEQCDYTVMIPMSHGVDSLNVAAASAVAFWQLCK